MERLGSRGTHADIATVKTLTFPAGIDVSRANVLMVNVSGNAARVSASDVPTSTNGWYIPKDVWVSLPYQFPDVVQIIGIGAASVQWQWGVE